MNAPFRVPTSTLTLLICLSLLGFDKNSHDCPGCIRLSWAQFVSTWVVKPSLEKLHQPQALSFWDHKFRQARGEYLTPMRASSRTPMFWGPSWTPRRELYYRNLQMQRGRGCLLISGAAQQPETANECIWKNLAILASCDSETWGRASHISHPSRNRAACSSPCRLLGIGV